MKKKKKKNSQIKIYILKLNKVISWSIIFLTSKGLDIVKIITSFDYKSFDIAIKKIQSLKKKLAIRIDFSRNQKIVWKF